MDTQALWREFKRTEDPVRAKALRDRLILTSHQPREVRRRPTWSGLPAHVEEDLVSYGLLGLIGAIERFDINRDIKFETYAIARIKGSIIDELRSMDWVPRSVRAGAREIERTIAQLEAKLARAPTDEEIAARLGITEDEFQDSLMEISRTSIAALDELWTSSSTGGDPVAVIDTIADPDAAEPQSAMAHTELREALGRRSRACPSARSWS